MGRLKRAAIEKLAASMNLHVVYIKKYAPMVKRVEKKDRQKAKDNAKKADPEKKAPAAADEKKDATKASPTLESTGKMSSQAVSQAQQSQQHRHDKQI